MKKSSQFIGLVALVVISFWIIGTLLVAYDDYKVITAHGIIGCLFGLAFLFSGGLRLMFSTTSRKVIGFGGGLFIYSALFISLVIFANYFAYNYEFLNYDSTEQKIHTLAPQTIKILNTVTEPLTIKAFFVGGIIKDAKIENLLNRIAKHSKHISWELIDPEQEPTLVQKYGISQNATVHLSYGSGENKRSATVARSITEQEMTNAILKITKGSAKKIYYITGHDEPKLNDEEGQGLSFAKKAIEGENLILEPLDLTKSESIPKDASCIILMAPKKSLSDKERSALIEFISNGGNALFLHEPKTAPDISDISSQFGIKIDNNVIVDKVVKLYEGPSLGVQPVIENYEQHPITNGFTQSILLSITASVVPKESTSTDNPKISVLARTSKESWGETNLDLLFSDEPSANLDVNDLKGPLPIAVAYEKINTSNNNQPPSRIVVMGDADFATNLFIHQLANRDFLLNTINWIVGEDETISIRPRTLKQATDSISVRQINMMFMITVIIIPELLIIMGLWVWWFRR